MFNPFGIVTWRYKLGKWKLKRFTRAQQISIVLTAQQID